VIVGLQIPSFIFLLFFFLLEVFGESLLFKRLFCLFLHVLLVGLQSHFHLVLFEYGLFLFGALLLLVYLRLLVLLSVLVLFLI
jgi:hypothetical protein